MNSKSAGFKGKVTQVKEKFGALRFYTTATTDLCQSIIDNAEIESTTICEACGRKGKLRKIGWLVTLCWIHYFELKFEKFLRILSK